MEHLTFGKIYIQNEDGSYSELAHITDMPTITDEIEPSYTGVISNPDDYNITMTFDRMSNKAIAALLGWRARGPVRRRQWKNALRMKPYKGQEAILWEQCICSLSTGKK